MLIFKKEKAFTNSKIIFDEDDRQYFDILRRII